MPKTTFKKGNIPHNKGQTKDQQIALGKKVGGWPRNNSRAAETCRRIGEANRGHVPWNKGLTKAESLSLKGGRPKGGIPWNKGKTGVFSEETLRKIGEASSRYIRSREHLDKLTQGRKAKGYTQETRKRIGEKASMNLKRLWKDPQYVLMQIQKRGVKPNKREREYIDYFESYFPDFKYNGDGRLGVVLAGLVPDFVNINGKKQVIEIFGEYFHSLRNKKLKWHQTEVGRIARYKEVGFNCLVLWSLEIKNPELVRKKVKLFYEPQEGSGE